MRGDPTSLLRHQPLSGETEVTNPNEADERFSLLGRQAGIKDSGDLDTGEQEQARLIADGVQAWKKLYPSKHVPDPTHAVVPIDPTAAVGQGAAAPDSATASSTSPSSSLTIEEGSGDKSRKPSDTESSQIPVEHVEGGLKCPFASTFGSMPTHHPLKRQPISSTQRPESLPTSREGRAGPLKSSSVPPPQRQPDDIPSAPPSATGSASKCPIRFLDHYSPEEVAEYFKRHKHEIPRSHEVCVKRYQNNAESIRELDAKYGSLVTMLQGLGAKHQPLLPAQAQEENGFEPALAGKSLSKIRTWAEGVGDAASGINRINPEAAPQTQDAYNDAPQISSREGRFERPLNNIRVGESPTRPWGIPVPFGEDAAESVAGGQTSLLQERPQSMAGVAGVESHRERKREREQEQPRMLFTGPVFIGYAPEQAAVLLRETGLGRRDEEG